MCVCVCVCRGVTLESLCQSVHKSGFCPDSNLLNLITIYSQLAVVVSDHKPEYHVNFFFLFFFIAIFRVKVTVRAHIIN